LVVVKVLEEEPPVAIKVRGLHYRAMAMLLDSVEDEEARSTAKVGGWVIDGWNQVSCVP